MLENEFNGSPIKKRFKMTLRLKIQMLLDRVIETSMRNRFLGNVSIIVVNLWLQYIHKKHFIAFIMLKLKTYWLR